MKNSLRWSSIISASMHTLIVMLAVVNFTKAPTKNVPQVIMTAELSAIAEIPVKPASITLKAPAVTQPIAPIEPIEIEKQLSEEKTQEETPKKEPLLKENKVLPIENLPIKSEITVPVKPEIKEKAKEVAPRPAHKDPAPKKAIHIPPKPAKKAASPPKSVNKKTNTDLFDILGDSMEELTQSANTAKTGSKEARDGYADAGILSDTELNIMIGKISNFWYISNQSQRSQKFRAELFIRLSINGEVEEVKVLNVRCLSSEQHCRALVKATERAVYAAAPFSDLAPERYHVWKEIQLNFEPLN